MFSFLLKRTGDPRNDYSTSVIRGITIIILGGKKIKLLENLFHREMGTDLKKK